MITLNIRAQVMEIEKLAVGAALDYEISQLPSLEVPDLSSNGETPIQPALWTEEEERIITEPYEYLISHPGKDIRKQILHACNVWLKVDPYALEVISCTVSMLHNASLLFVMIMLTRPTPKGHH